MNRVLFIGAHADDPVLAAAGRILFHIARGDKVHVVVCHDSRTAFRAVHKCEERPNLIELGAAVRSEFVNAMGVLRVKSWDILDLPGEEGRPSQNARELYQELLDWTTARGSGGTVYYHMPDAHIDHRAVAAAMDGVVEFINTVDYSWQPVEAFKFMVWDRKLAKLQGQANMDLSQVPEIPANAIRFTLAPDELEIKRRAIACFRSQVEPHPYPDWDPQPHAVLNDKFLQYFLRGEELLIPV